MISPPSLHTVKSKLFALGVGFLLFMTSTSSSYALDNLECIAPAKPGGGHDLFCQLLSRSLTASRLISTPMKITYMPGGIGALAYNYIAASGPQKPHSVVAFSTGSALNIAQKKFGRYDETSVKWLAALVTDYGVLAVSKRAPWQNLEELIQALRTNPDKVIFGAGGSIGSQDWMKSALLLRSAGLDPREIRYVSYEGGGEAINALMSDHIQVFPGDLAEASTYATSGEIKILAVFSSKRLEGAYHHIPTAREQGYPIEWPIWRGLYLPPHVSANDYDWWQNTLRRLVKSKTFNEERQKLGFFPFTLIGAEFDGFVQTSVKELRALALDFDLIK